MKGCRFSSLALVCWLVAGMASATNATASFQSSSQPLACSAKTRESATSLVDIEQVVMCACASRGLLIVGEIHGSNETPTLVSALLKKTLVTRPVRLGLEIPVTEQASIENYLRSSGEPADRTKLLTGPFWNQMRDGRSSEAMLQLIESVHTLKVAGADVDIFAMEPDYGSQMDAVKRDGFMSVKESGMAQSIRTAISQGKSARLVIALMGNFHARDSAVGLFKGSPTGSVTERLGSLSPYVVLPFARSEATWNCTDKGCGIHAATSTQAPTGTLPTLVTDVREPSGPTVVTLWLATLTASLPAKPEDAPAPKSSNKRS
jgi:hypothetical protein